MCMKFIDRDKGSSAHTTHLAKKDLRKYVNSVVTDQLAQMCSLTCKLHCPLFSKIGSHKQTDTVAQIRQCGCPGWSWALLITWPFSIIKLLIYINCLRLLIKQAPDEHWKLYWLIYAMNWYNTFSAADESVTVTTDLNPYAATVNICCMLCVNSVAPDQHGYLYVALYVNDIQVNSVAPDQRGYLYVALDINDT